MGHRVRFQNDLRSGNPPAGQSLDLKGAGPSRGESCDERGCKAPHGPRRKGISRDPEATSSRILPVVTRTVEIVTPG
eukprot:3317902-Rhodomonas_salina.1